jgi:hypothetical protein
MRRVPETAAAVFSLNLAAYLSTVSVGLAEAARGSQPNPCAAPNEVGPSFEETAWQIWVAATCPVNSDQYPFVVWENWIEQAQLYPADPSQGLKVPNSGAPTGIICLPSTPTAPMALHCCRPLLPIPSGSRNLCRQRIGSDGSLSGRCCWPAQVRTVISTCALRRRP